MDARILLQLAGHRRRHRVVRLEVSADRQMRVAEHAAQNPPRRREVFDTLVPDDAADKTDSRRSRGNSKMFAEPRVLRGAVQGRIESPCVNPGTSPASQHPDLRRLTRGK